MVRDPKTWPRLEKYVKDIIESFMDDSRVWVRDLYNELSIAGQGGDSSLVRQVFTWAREARPSQPLTVCQWGPETLNKIISQESDIITFHQYSDAEALQKTITELKKYGRPIICTEWMARTRGSLFKSHLPIFLRENVGCMHWGLVNGKTQTHYPWGSKPGDPEPEVWFVDLYRNDHTPYDQEEIEIIKWHIFASEKQRQ